MKKTQKTAFPVEIEGAIFDMDGTLIDSMYIWDIVGIRYLENMGITPAPGLREQLRPLSLNQAAAYFQKHCLPSLTIAEILDGLSHIVEREYCTHVPLKPGVTALLEHLTRKQVPMAVATATDRKIVEQVLTRLNIRHYFSAIFSCLEYGTGKDQPLIFEKALQFLGTKKERTIIFEDALHAITTAKKAGFPVVGVFDQSESINEQQIVALCDTYCLSLEEFLL